MSKVILAEYRPSDGNESFLIIIQQRADNPDRYDDLWVSAGICEKNIAIDEHTHIFGELGNQTDWLTIAKQKFPEAFI